MDLNGDGAPDLYLANDFEDRDQLWFNDGRGGFRLAGWTAQRQISNSTMGVDVGDVNGDGLPDLFEVDMLSNDAHRLKTQMPTHTPLPKRPGDMGTQLQQQRNTLFVNRGEVRRRRLADAGGGWSWSTMFLDVDLDGRWTFSSRTATCGTSWMPTRSDPVAHWFHPVAAAPVEFRGRC